MVEYLSTEDIQILYKTLQTLLAISPFFWPSMAKNQQQLLSGLAHVIIYTEDYRSGKLLVNRPTGRDVSQAMLDTALQSCLDRLVDVADEACETDAEHYRAHHTAFQKWLPENLFITKTKTMKSL